MRDTGVILATSTGSSNIGGRTDTASSALSDQLLRAGIKQTRRCSTTIPPTITVRTTDDETKIVPDIVVVEGQISTRLRTCKIATSKEIETFSSLTKKTTTGKISSSTRYPGRMSISAGQ